MNKVLERQMDFDRDLFLAAAAEAAKIDSDTHDPILGTQAAMLECAVKRASELQEFKDFVHGRLDGMAVPKEFPDGPHTREGCRIGDRLDYLWAEVERLRAGLVRCKNIALNAENPGDMHDAILTAVERAGVK